MILTVSSIGKRRAAVNKGDVSERMSLAWAGKAGQVWINPRQSRGPFLLL